MRAALLAVGLFFLGGCAHGQTVLTHTAEVLAVDTQGLRVDFHVAQDAHCRAEYPPELHAFEDWRACMEPSYRLDAAVGVLDGALRASQAAFDAGGRDAFRETLPDLMRAARAVRDIVGEFADIPDEIDMILSLGGAL